MDTIHRFFHNYYGVLATLVVLVEVVLNVAIIHRIPYTEIDWIAYMQEVGGFLKGDWNYMHLKGDTGPLVYPAGFLYIFSILKFATNDGIDIRKAQYIFAGIYCVMIATLLIIYRKVMLSMQDGYKKMPALYIFILLCCSRRIHSIFVLRLFNDTIAMTFLYMAVASFIIDRWSLGCVLISFALSIKMNILLFFPGLAVLLTKRYGFGGAIGRIVMIFSIQAALAVPFLMGNPSGYMNRAFEFSREFFYIWTVNFKFLPEEIFLSKKLALGLLAGHLLTLIGYGFTKWTSADGGPFKLIFRGNVGKKISAEHIVSLLFVSNFVGIVFARSLHFQFYVWYYHTLPFILWSIPHLHSSIRFIIIIAIEVIWNVFPSRFETSLALTVIHAVLLLLVTFSPQLYAYKADKQKKNK